MANITTDQNFPNVALTITNAKGGAATVDGVPVWASSDDTVLAVLAADDGMSASVNTVAAGVARITVSADADLGAGVTEITGVSEDVTVTIGTASQATTIALNLGEPVDKP